MPQAKQGNPEPDAPDTGTDAGTDAGTTGTPENGAALGGGMAEAASAFAGLLVEQANDLERKRSALMAQIAKNRDELRNLDELGALTPEAGEWLDAFYPTKERGAQRSKEEVEATRKAKLAARKGAVPA